MGGGGGATPELGSTDCRAIELGSAKSAQMVPSRCGERPNNNAKIGPNDEIWRRPEP